MEKMDTSMENEEGLPPAISKTNKTPNKGDNNGLNSPGETVGNGGGGVGRGRGWPKGKKRYPKSPGAPKCSLSAYVHFLNDRRESFRKENPELSFAEVSKSLAVEWSSLSADDKIKYNEMAEADKERYNREFEEYTQTDQYKEYVEIMEKKKAQKKAEKMEQKAAKKAKKKSGGDAIISDNNSSTAPTTNETKSPIAGPSNIKPIKGGFDIPIFTDEFLEHNKSKESELRLLKRQTNDYEEQNAVLQKHVDNMTSAVEKLERENAAVMENNAALEKHLEEMQQLIIANFSSIPLKKHSGRLNKENVDDYINELNSVLLKEKDDNKLLLKLKDAASKIDISHINFNPSTTT